MLKLFRIIPKDHGKYAYGYYELFIVAAASIPDALEVIYRHVCPEEEEIPYYLRSSNLKIEQLGTVELNHNVPQLIATSYYSGD